MTVTKTGTGNSERGSRQRWRALLAPYEGPDDRRSARQLGITVAQYLLGWAAMWQSLEVGTWLALIVGLPTAGVMVRLFVIQHDCGHGAYFASQRVADAVGGVLATLIMTPYQYWRRNHARHHAHAGKLDERTVGDVPTLTIGEYEALGRCARLRYRIVRNPALMIGLLTALHFIVGHRCPWTMPREWRREWRSVWRTNAVLAAVLAGAWLAGCIERVLIIQGIVMVYGCALAGWLTHTQHQFEEAYWRRHGEWSFVDVGLRGSSWMALPRPLQWLTASIGLHHVHHLSTRIPNYRLQRCIDEIPQLASVRRLTLRDGFKSLHLALWDEESARLVSFGEYAKRVRNDESHNEGRPGLYPT